MPATKTGPAPYLLLATLCLALYLPGFFTVPPVDRDEARFAQATRQMRETGDYVRIRFQDAPRHKKPVGVYWLQAASASLVGDPGDNRIWPYRIPSLIGAILAVLLTFRVGIRLFDRDTAFLGAVLLAASLLLTVEAHLAKSDAALLASAMAAQYALARIYMDFREGKELSRSDTFLFWIAAGIGTLLKGPVVPMICGLTGLGLAAADRNIRWLRRLWSPAGIGLAALIVLPWAVSIWVATDGTFFTRAFREDVLPKLTGGHESHGAPPGFYLALFFATFYPGVLFAPSGLAAAFRERALPGVRFCLLWIVPFWVAFELIPTKLPHYVLPTYPAIALLTARGVRAADGAVRAGRTFLSRLGVGFYTLVTVILAAGAVAIPLLLSGLPGPASVFALSAGVFVPVFLFRSLGRRKPVSAAAIAVLGSGLLVGTLVQSVLPKIDALWISRTADRVLTDYSRNRGGKPFHLVASGYDEPSLVFFRGTDTLLTSPTNAAKTILSRPDTLVLVSDHVTERFLKRVAKLGGNVKAVASFTGYSYSNGKWMDVTIYRSSK